MSTGAKSRAVKNTADMVRSLGVTLVGGAVLFGTVFFVFYRDSKVEEVKPADPNNVTVSLNQARRDFPGALLPTSTPAGWTVTVVRYGPADPSRTDGASVLHIGYITARSGSKEYVDLEVGASIDKALDPFDGGVTVPVGVVVGGLQQLKAPDGTITLRTPAGETPATGLTGTKDVAQLTKLASVLRRGGG